MKATAKLTHWNNIEIYDCGRADDGTFDNVMELLTGRTPFVSKNVLELLTAHRDFEVVPPTRHNELIPADLDPLIHKCMGKKTGDRFQEVTGLMVALDASSAAGLWGEEQAANWRRSNGPEMVSATDHRIGS